MKRYIAILLCMAVAAGVAACQPTPEQAVVVKKDTERMIEQAQASDTGGNSLISALGIPDKYNVNETYFDGKMLLSGEAPVYLPSVETVPIVEVAPSDFSQEFIDKAYKALVGDMEMYQVQHGVVLKANLEAQIMNLQKRIADPNTNAEQKSYDEETLSKLKELYNSKYAVDTFEWIKGSTQLTELYKYGQYTMDKTENYYGVALSESPDDSVDNVIRFSVNNSSVGEDVSKDAVLLYENGSIEPSDTSVTYQWGTVSADNYPPELVDLSGFTPEQAYKQGEKLIEDLGLSEVVSLGNMYLNIVFSNPTEAAQVSAFANKNQLTKQEALNFDEIYKESLQSCALNAQGDVRIYYTLNYCRNISGVLVTHDVPSTFVTDEAWGPQWVHEDIVLSVMPEGIGSFSWNSPYKVTNVMAKNSSMLPFSDISSIFKKMILYENEQLFDSADINSGLSQLEFVVTKVTLSLQRIIEKNNIDNGLLVPVWNFYGVQIGRSKDGLEIALKKDTPFVSVNAVDGSIIDLARGY